MQGASTIILATIIGAMIAFDRGGPFNKVAFLFGSGLIAEGTYNVMGAVAVAVCIPPIALGIASKVFKNKFTEQDSQAGTTAMTMGFFGITEGAIPFAAKDPLRVIPSIVIGSVVGSIVAMLTGVGGHVAHGGPIVALLGAVDNVIMYFLAVIAGVATTVLLLGVLKKDVSSTEETAILEIEPSIDNQDELTLADLTDLDLIKLDISSQNKDQAFIEFLNNPMLANYIGDADIVLEAVKDRERQSTTGMGDGVAIPHA